MKQSSMSVLPKGLMPSPFLRQVKIFVHFTSFGCPSLQGLISMSE